MIKVDVPDRVIKEAVELKLSSCYPAMSMANAIGGSRSQVWDVARGNKVVDLIASAIARGMDVSKWKTAVDGKDIAESGAYNSAISIISRLTESGAKLNKNGWYSDGVFLGNDVKSAIECLGN